MSIAGNKQYIAVAYEGTLELWNPQYKTRIVHELDPDIKIVKVECNWQGGIALTNKGKVILFDHRRMTFQTDQFITDISCSDKDFIIVTSSGKFIRIGRKGVTIPSAPPPLKISVGPAKYAFISMGKLYIDEQLIKHDKYITQVAVGGGHTIFINEDGEVYGFGNNTNFQLGQKVYKNEDELETYITDPIKIPLPKIKKVVAGHEHSVALDYEGKTYHFGSTYKEGPVVDKVVPLKFDNLIEDIYARCNITLILFKNGDIEHIGTK